MSSEIQNLRKQIDKIDNLLLKFLSKRIQISKQIGKFKKQNNLPIRDKKREKQLFILLSQKAEKFNLDKKYINQLFKLILKNSRDNQK
jgi:chorismate mutase